MVRSPSDLRESCAAIRQQKNAAREKLAAEFKAGRPVGRILAEYTATIDRSMQAIWHWHKLPAGAALVAVGGYGRRELFPYSDVDVLILLPRAPQPSEATVLETLVSNMWDAGLEIGHSVRTVDECLQESASDITIQTGLIEARHICGKAGLTRELLKKVFEGLDNPNEILKTDGDYPILLVRSLRKEIHIETLCILNQLLNFFPMWNKKIADTIRWPEYQRKVIKYASFLPQDTVKYKLILKKVI